ncbi:MAG TPA: hypothetical protein P5050_04235 [Bacteroidia bacterium]|nr:hypothetical protein [Bacteroidia bacterium]HRS58410.1 hypothetical protein [Bacteroidia bacterium]HRU67359.1 hypothetical protein [Bacteroidia bacterium]
MIHTLYPLWLIIFCIILGFTLTWLMYGKKSFFRNEKLLSFPKSLLILLRFLTITLISFFLLSPFIKKFYKKIEKPFIVMAFDNSESIVLNEDSQYYRKDFFNEYNDLKEKLSEKYEVISYSFGSEVKKNAKADFKEKRTDISAMINSLYEQTYNRNAGAIIIMSDGIYNQGSDPLLASPVFSCPVYTVALGDTSPRRDLKIKNVVFNDISFKGNQFPVKMFIEARKCRGESAVLKIIHNGKTVFNTTIPIKDNIFFYETDALIDAEESGIQKYTVTLNFLKNEITWKNNIRDFYVEVLENKNKILLIGNSPHPDISAIKSAFRESNNFEVEDYLAAEIEANPALLDKNISNRTVVILHQLPSENQPAVKILDYLNKQKIPVLYILGSQSSAGNFNRLNTGLQILQNKRSFENAQPVLSEHFSYFELENSPSGMINELPPLTTFYGNYKISGENQTLFYQKIGNVKTERPLIVFFRNEEKRAALICGEGIWRWKMTEFKLSGKTEFFNEFLSKTIRFLSLKEDRRLFRFSQPTYVFDEDEQIEIFVELLNKSYEKQKNAQIMLSVINSENKSTNFQFQESSEGYRVNAGYFPEGQYLLVAETIIDGKKTQIKAILIVKKTELEHLELTADHHLMYQLAINNNGKMFYPETMNQLTKEIFNSKEIKPVTFFSYETRDLIDNKVIFFLIVFLLAAEWFLRKYFGSY